LARVSNWWHEPAWTPAPFVKLWEVVGEVGVAGSWRSDDVDSVWQPRCGSPYVSMFRVGSQVGSGGVSSVVVFHDDIGALYGFLADSPANEQANSLLLLNKTSMVALVNPRKTLSSLL
jgi:hypothetical protein